MLHYRQITSSMLQAQHITILFNRVYFISKLIFPYTALFINYKDNILFSLIYLFLNFIYIIRGKPVITIFNKVFNFYYIEQINVSILFFYKYYLILFNFKKGLKLRIYRSKQIFSFELNSLVTIFNKKLTHKSIIFRTNYGTEYNFFQSNNYYYKLYTDSSYLRNFNFKKSVCILGFYVEMFIESQILSQNILYFFSRHPSHIYPVIVLVIPKLLFLIKIIINLRLFYFNSESFNTLLLIIKSIKLNFLSLFLNPIIVYGVTPITSSYKRIFAG